MSDSIKDKGMQQAKGGVFAQSDIELLKKALEFYLKNDETLDKLATLYGIETDAQLEERLSKMSKEEMKQELEKS